MTSAPAIRISGLDGLRAIAVALVLAYHLLPPAWVPSGMIGVDVFFVISGFLITSLLLEGRRRHPDRRLADFWMRRARRILPALAVVVVLFSTGAWLFGKDAAVGLPWQVAGAATFTYNWFSIAMGGGYFAVDTPELFRNLWSLAVEEQFYLVLPLVLPLLMLLRRPIARAAVALTVAVASAIWMVVLAGEPGEVSRAYLGTDTHAFGLLLGVALAFLLERRLLQNARAAMTLPAGNGWTIVHPHTQPRVKRVIARQRRVGIAAAVLGAAAVAGIVVLALQRPVDLPFTLELATGLAAIAIIACVWPGSRLGRILDNTPMRWLGSRSYAVYLWHWPLLVLIAAGASNDAWIADPPLVLGLGTIAIALVCAELSFRFVETPMRRLGYKGAARAFGGWLVGSVGARLRALALLSIAVVLVTTTTTAVALAPAQTSAQEAVAAGAAALREPQPTAPATHTPTPTPTPTATDSASPDPTPQASDPPVTPALPPVTGDQVSVIGDSVTLASAGALLARLPGIQIDAHVSRQWDAAPAILQTLAQRGQLRDYVVVALGTNGSASDMILDEIRRVIGPDRRLVLMTAFAPRSWIPPGNATVTAYVTSHPNTALADWATAISTHTNLLAPDQIHPGQAGGRIFADTLAAALAEAQQEASNPADSDPTSPH